MPMEKCPKCHRTVHSWGRICPKCEYEQPRPEDVGDFKTGERVYLRSTGGTATLVREGRQETSWDSTKNKYVPIGPRKFWIRHDPDGPLDCVDQYDFEKVGS